MISENEYHDLWHSPTGLDGTMFTTEDLSGYVEVGDTVWIRYP